jgi:hypothetical protein
MAHVSINFGPQNCGAVPGIESNCVLVDAEFLVTRLDRPAGSTRDLLMGTAVATNASTNSHDPRTGCGTVACTQPTGTNGSILSSPQTVKGSLGNM